MKKAICVFISIQIIFGALTANAAYAGSSYISSAGACVMDFESGDILYEYNGYRARVPASMTKIMTLYCVYSAIEAGEISLDTHVPISSNVYNKSRNQLYQNMLPLNYNTVYTVNELMDASAVYSASAATVALAELLGGGSETAFVARMNNTAKTMGLDAHYYDSCGVADNSITPVSMATLARNIIRDYPDILNRTSKKSIYFHGGTYKTTNHLLDTYFYMGADGMKTGTGTAAGACFCGTALRDGRRMISVTMGSSSSGQRFTDTIRLLNYGFDIAREKYPAIYYTDMRTFVNKCEVPTFYCGGEAKQAVIIAEDLANYGFDVTYDDSSRTLRLLRNYEKAANPIALDIYKNKNGQWAFGVKQSDIKVVLEDGDLNYTFSGVYNTGKYMCISADEFASVYNFAWNDSERAAYIDTARLAG